MRMIQISREYLDTLIDALYDYDLFEVREDYPGRGMYGQTCVGFVTDNSLKFHGALCAVLAERAATEGSEEVEWFDLTPRTDSMGLSSIVYYNLQISDD